MEEKMIEGVCKYCGQMKVVSAINEEDANIKVTDECDCDEAASDREKKRIIDRIEEQVTRPEAETRILPFNDEQVKDALHFAVLVFYNKYPQIQYTVNDCVVTITRTKGEVEFVRSKKIKEVS